MHTRLSVWPPLPPDVYLRRPFRSLPYPLDEPTCRVVAWARHGVWHGARALGLHAGDGVLVPAWHHGSEVEALLGAGLDCRFYESTPSLEPDPEELDGLLDSNVRALYLTHFLGFPRDFRRWREWCDARGLLLIEDAAQAWLATRDGRPVGSLGDLAVFCLYKTFGLPEGAALVQASPRPAVGLDRRPGLGPLARQHGMWCAGRSSAVYAATAPLRRSRSKPYAPELDFALRDPDSAPWSTTSFLLRRISDPAAAERRRENYRLLLSHLSELVPAPFGDLPDGASPFAFPIQVDGKGRILAGLRERGINALDLWSVPHPSLARELFPGAADRRATTVGLPVHQELRRSDLERIAIAVRDIPGSP